MAMLKFLVGILLSLAVKLIPVMTLPSPATSPFLESVMMGLLWTKTYRKRGRLLIYPVTPSSEYGGRSVPFTFEIKLDVTRPEQIVFADHVLESKDTCLAA